MLGLLKKNPKQTNKATPQKSPKEKAEKPNTIIISKTDQLR